MASAWVARRARSGGGVSYRVLFRIGGRESSPRYAGALSTMREATIRRNWVAGELAAMRGRISASSPSPSHHQPSLSSPGVGKRAEWTSARTRSSSTDLQSDASCRSSASTRSTRSRPMTCRIL